MTKKLTRIERLQQELEQMAESNQELRQNLKDTEHAFHNQGAALESWKKRAMTNLEIATRLEQELEIVRKQRDSAWLRLGELVSKPGGLEGLFDQVKRHVAEIKAQCSTVDQEQRLGCGPQGMPAGPQGVQG